MRRNYSRLQNIEDKRSSKHALILIAASVFLVIFFAVFGLPIVARFAQILIGINKSGSAVVSDDTTPPPPPKITDLPEYLNQEEVEVSGVTEPGATVKIYFNGTTKELLASSSGNFSTNFSLSEGENIVYAVSTDNRGNVSEQSNTSIVTLDKEAPELEISEPQEGTNFYGNRQRQVIIKGQTENGARVTINDRIVVVENTGIFTYYTSLGEGNNTFAIKSADRAGNEREKTLNLIFSP
ncbi:hypothetical protein A3D84_00925 [Candidatus Woesebacteria bacterium RIFCSPHIGHO2_02_FULL_42_20]|uniref:Bacterial Ig domain-containing protein n=1 Tax=Candidatus Woesebacteria bacterium RIFCSPHIGHO2_12_FULL_41_24 TaxID=1802510 RepID=A0A1F8AQV6_9BACT|nr:MAG: hypothetical protein A2W15_05150 [Candidatus Woesebacteria bacterium RBG_16_41_13]OGM30683.1 MAG: hypothetical protein A2873_01045 [Candidatus Woesebacteria bacterium RIFCSPHIGHO2_01_FULL_42_80]OGM35820.1 MAG: hypothetical protein A3D84_00925 [Candidatus Woesebacteria bacterium RIFCSPHIGHO2_02_FULL_42_20]OGM53879.1 MAG: hypothetical protein A3E44_05695 [Candidatus Woesebacteria bacterium RIFCSPHIGHO2_12_FULL_41_24]OGM66071.1 MAG: hypothetical protein A2969_03790 [Candidatus Woesebacteri